MFSSFCQAASLKSSNNSEPKARTDLAIPPTVSAPTLDLSNSPSTVSPACLS